MIVARVLASLLLLCLAIPAVATSTCHEQPAVASVTDDPHAGHHQPQKAPGQHDRSRAAIHGCIGCVPPLAGIGAPPARAEMIGIIVPSGPIDTFSAGTTAPPDPPPPRYPV